MLSPIHLDKIFNVYLNKIKEQLKAAPTFLSMTSDMWSDKYKHRSFICFTTHFIDSSFRLHKYNLKTEPFDGSHTGEAIAQRISHVAIEYNLNVNNLIAVSKIANIPKHLIHIALLSSFDQVSDRGSNMLKAWRLLKLIHVGCVAHGIHNLLMKDCFPRMNGVPALLDKIQLIINKLRYRQHELEEEFNRSNDRLDGGLLEIINKLGEVLDADCVSSSIDTVESSELIENIENCRTPDVSFFSDVEPDQLFDQNRTESGPLLPTKPLDPSRFHTLKKRVLTRWNTILTMLRSYSSNISGIETLLRRLKQYDLLLSDGENQTVKDLVEFLSLFESTTTILSASKSYPTMNLYLLLRMVSVWTRIFAAYASNSRVFIFVHVCCRK